MFDISVLILTYNTKKITLNCLKSIFKSETKLKFRVCVLDNGTDGTDIEIKKSFSKVEAFNNGVNMGFVKGNNYLIKNVYEKSKYVLLLNSDTLLYPDTLEKLYSFAESNETDIATCYLENKDHKFQPNLGDLPTFLPLVLWLSGLDGLINQIANIPSFHLDNKRYYKDGVMAGWISGSVMLIKSSLFNKIGYFDEKIFMYGEDTDFCWRAGKVNAKIQWTNSTRVIHLGGASTTTPKYTQWKGEFASLKYLFKKNYNFFTSVFYDFLLYLFLGLRIVGYSLIGNSSYARTYAKIAINI